MLVIIFYVFRYIFASFCALYVLHFSLFWRSSSIAIENMFRRVLEEKKVVLKKFPS
jgi:hypothetical protein